MYVLGFSLSFLQTTKTRMSDAFLMCLMLFLGHPVIRKTVFFNEWILRLPFFFFFPFSRNTRKGKELDLSRTQIWWIRWSLTNCFNNSISFHLYIIHQQWVLLSWKQNKLDYGSISGLWYLIKLDFAAVVTFAVWSRVVFRCCGCRGASGGGPKRNPRILRVQRRAALRMLTALSVY